jgi:hypothetical protein
LHTISLVGTKNIEDKESKKQAIALRETLLKEVLKNHGYEGSCKEIKVEDFDGIKMDLEKFVDEINCVKAETKC